MTSGVYAITNTATGDQYIGSSSNLANRLATHKKLLNAGKHWITPLQQTYSDHGASCLTWDILEFVENTHSLPERELSWIEAYNPVYNTYQKVSQAASPAPAISREAFVSLGSMGRPLRYQEPRKRLTIELPNALVQRIDDSAARKGITRTRFIEEALDQAAIRHLTITVKQKAEEVK